MLARVGVLLLVLAVLLGGFLAADRFLTGRAAQQALQRDEGGRVTARSAPRGRVARYEYDGGGRIAAIRYTQRGGLTGWTYPGGEKVRFAYDPAGNRVEVQDGSGTIQYAYDDLGRATTVIGSHGRSVSYAYDPWDRVHRLIDPAGEAVDYEHDLFGLVQRVHTAGGDVRYVFDPATLRTVRTLPNGIETVYQQSQAGTLTSITHRKGNRLFAAFEYTYDADARVRSVVERSPRGTSRSEYRYDVLGRLVEVVGPGSAKTTYSYDAVGNRTAERGPEGAIDYEYDAEGRLVRAGSVRFEYDETGNVIRSGGTTYEYDAEGRLAAVDGDADVRYAYDGEGFRVGRRSDDADTQFVHDRVRIIPQLLADLDDDGNVLRSYLHGRTRVAQREAGGETLYLLEDRLGSTRCVVDQNGKVVSRYEYSPFGAPRLVEGTERTRFLFAGEEWDPATGLVYLRARDYDPRLGRFLSPDPLDGDPLEPQSYNAYAYALNDPLNRVDPTGMQSGRWPPPPPPPPYSHYDRLRQQFADYHRYNSGYYDAHLFRYPQHPPSVPWYERSPPPLNGLFNATNGWQSLGRMAVYASPLFVTTPPGVFMTGCAVCVLTVNDFAWAVSQRNWWDAASTVAPYAARGIATVANFRELARQIERYESYYDVTTELAANPWLQHLGKPRESRDLLDYVADLDPLLGRSLNETRNIFFPPPGGGGGGGFPLVGGVYLDQTAKMIGELGTISGATFDPKSGRLILVGEKRTALPPMRADYLAAALRAVYTESEHEPGMTIDPHPQDPHSPVMLVRFFGNTENTRLGAVMFEADRIMKGYSIGRDNVTRAPVQSKIAGYRSVTQMALADPGGDSGLWSRFWLVPEPVTARVSSDGASILFDPIRLRVKTETMRWDGGQLVPAGNIRDEHAEAFAAHFSARYPDYAREQPVYAELEQVTRAVALAKWMKEQRVPIDWGAMRILGGAPYPTPSTTPAAVARETKSWSDGLGIRTLTIHSFGGVEMTPRIAARKDREAEAFREAVLKAARGKGSEAFDVRVDGRDLRAISLPSAAEPELGSYRVVERDLAATPDCAGGVPGLVRAYDSLHNEASEFGYGWSLLMPRLEFEGDEKEGSAYLTVEGDPATRVLVQRFVLRDPFGMTRVRFEKSFVDQELDRIGFQPAEPSHYRALYPEEGLYRVFFKENDEQVLFDVEGKLVAVLSPTRRTIYEYDAGGRLAALRCTGGDDVLYGYDGRGLLSSISARGESASYGYDAAGNLVRVRSPRGDVSYRYDARRLLREVTIDGEVVAENDYDEAGRLIEQRTRSGKRTQKVEQRADGGRIVIADAERREYDAQLRLVKAQTAGGTANYTYRGKNVVVDAALVSGGTAHVEFDGLSRPTQVVDPAGNRTEIRYEAELPAEIRVNGRLRTQVRVDGAGRVREIVHDGGWSEQFMWDESGRLADYKRRGPRSRVEQPTPLPARPSLEQFTVHDRAIVHRTASGAATVLRYDRNGLLASVQDPSGGMTTYLYDAERRLREVRLPNGRRRLYGDLSSN